MPNDPNAKVMEEFEEELEANHLHALLGFSALLEDQIGRDPTDGKGFQLLINESICHFNISANEFSEEFDVHPTTVRRWASAETCPSKMVRPIILKWVVGIVEKKIENHKKALLLLGNIDQKVQYKMETLCSIQNGNIILAE